MKLVKTSCGYLNFWGSLREFKFNPGTNLGSGPPLQQQEDYRGKAAPGQEWG